MDDIDIVHLPDSSRPNSGALPAAHSNPHELYNRAIARFNDEQYALAERDLHTAIEITKTLPDTTARDNELAIMTLQRGVSAKFQQKWALAAMDFCIVVERYPDSKYAKQASGQLEEVKQVIGAKNELEARHERDTYLEAIRAHAAVRLGETWHVVSTQWLSKWERWVKLVPDHAERQANIIEEAADYPGPISNFAILEKEEQKKFLFDPLPENQYQNRYLTHGLTEDSDYKLVPDEAFALLNEKYKTIDDIIRYPIEVNETMFQVEVQLKTLTVAYCRNREPSIKKVQISRKATVQQLHEKLERCTDCSDTKLWKVSLNVFSVDQLNSVLKAEGVVYLENGKEMAGTVELEDAEVGEEDVLVLETKKRGVFFFTNDTQLVREVCAFCHVNKVTKHCSICGKVNYCTVLCERLHYQTHKPFCAKPRKRSFFLCIPCRQSSQLEDEDQAFARKAKGEGSRMGRTGLQNLGNTCYMNAALQCLSHTDLLTNWFLDNQYEAAINTKNPLSTGGRLARAYADLLRELWFGAAISHAPWGVRKVVTAVMSQFASLRMHDAHEFLLYFLDNLHEDLNQVKSKQYVEVNADSGASDVVQAEQAWEVHQRYNRSKVVELMHGQYKSTVTCTVCALVSTLFEPFSVLSLPIPKPKHKKTAIYFIFNDPEKTPVALQLYLPNEATFRDLRSNISTTLNISSDCFTFATITNDELKSVPTDPSLLSDITNTTLFAFESERKAWTPQLLVLNLLGGQGERSKISFPRLLFFSGESSAKEIHLEVFRKVRKFFIKCKQPASARTLASEYEAEKDKAYSLKVSKASLSQGICGLCGTRQCQSCPLPYSSAALEGLKQAAGGPFMLDLTWKPQLEKLGISLKDVNKCSEFQVPFEVKAAKIQDCFQLFADVEVLDAENYWHCPRCKKSVEARKTMELFRIPQVLVLHLKRFKSIGYILEKMGTPVESPMKGLDLSPYLSTRVSSKPIYDLYGCVCHLGATLQSGHYIAYCYNATSKGWLEFNDSKVRPVSADQVQIGTAYLLFYKLRA